MWKIITRFRSHKRPNCDNSFIVAESLKKHLILHPANIFFFAGSQCEKSLQDLGPLQANFRDNNIENSSCCSQCIMSFSEIKDCRNMWIVIQERGPSWPTSVPSVLNYSPPPRVFNSMWHYMLEWNRIYVIFVQNLLLRRVHFSLTCKFTQESCHIIAYNVLNLRSEIFTEGSYKKTHWWDKAT